MWIWIEVVVHVWHAMWIWTLGGSPCGMLGGTLLFFLLLVYNSVSTKLAKSTEKGANFC